jgi:hypothetical protein
LNSRKLKEPSVIAIIRPKNKRIQNRIWILDIFSFKKKNPKINAKMISDFIVKELIIGPARSYPIYSRIGTALKVNPIIRITFIPDIVFQPLIREKFFLSSFSLSNSVLLILNLSNKNIGKKSKVSIKAVTAPNKKGSITLGRALEITGCSPIVKIQIEAYIIPFLRL